MPLQIGWWEILLRLVLAVVAGAILGWDRRKHAHAAGMRTTLLVTLASALAMVMVNLLISQRGKAPDSFVQLDMMRLPLGVLTGVGFIGAGSIMRRGQAVTGVTTAATLWFCTVLGLVFGGGLIGLGLLGFAFAWVTLVVLKQVEQRMAQDKKGRLWFVVDRSTMSEQALRERIVAAGYKIMTWKVRYGPEGLRGACRVQWRGLEQDEGTPPLVKELAQTEGVRRVGWES